MTRKKIPAITKKGVLYIIIVDLLLSALVFAISFVAFNRQFRKQYDTSILEIAKTARALLNPDDFARYRENPVADEKYESVLENLQILVDQFDLTVIYVSAVAPPDYTHIFYFYDPVSRHGKWKPYPLGFEEDYYEPTYNRTTTRVLESGEHLVRHNVSSRSGYHITAQIPVFDSNGQIVALLGAQKNIQEFALARNSFVTFVAVTVLISAVFIVLLFTFYFDRHFIRPIVQITEETNRFSSSSSYNELGKILLSIKKRDEIGVLSHSIYKMERTIMTSMETQRRITLETAAALSSAIDAKDSYTHGHSSRVAEYSKAIAERAGLPASECSRIYFAALLHDVGKIGIPVSILNKKGRLTDEEYEMVKKHPVIGTQILSNITRPEHVSDGAHYHHERYDGKGYPEGLSGEDIPVVGRIIAVADAYDAMTSTRSYRDSLPQEFVRGQIAMGAGVQFDPEYARIMLAMIDEDTEYKMRENGADKENV